MASDKLKIIANLKRNESLIKLLGKWLIKIVFSRPNEIRLNFMASDKLKIPSNLLRNETFYVMKKNL